MSFYRYGRVNPVLVEQINVISTQACEGLLYHHRDARWLTIEPFRRFAVFETEPGGNHDLITEWRLTHDFFVELTIGPGGIKEGNAAQMLRVSA